MPRPGGMNVPLKSKDFKGTMIRLFKNLDKWRKMIIICTVLALFSAILSTIAPSKLSSITNIITTGIKPNINALQEVYINIYRNAFKNYEGSLANPMEFEEYFTNLNSFEKQKLLTEINVNNSAISIDDQIKFIDLQNNLKDNKQNELKLIDELPESIKTIVIPKMNTKSINIRVLVLAIIYILSSLFNYIQGRIMAEVSNAYSKKLRNDISLKINKLPLKYFDTHETGDILSRVTNDIDSIGMNMNTSLSTLVANITLFLGSILMMFITNWIMAFTAIFASIFGFAFSAVLLKKSQKYFIERQNELGNLNAHIEEIYSGHNVVKTYNGEEDALKEFDEINNRLYDCNRKSQFLSGIMQPIMGFIGNFGYVAVCVVGAVLVMNNKTTFGSIVAFMIYIRLFTNPLSQIAQALTGLQSTAAAQERVFEFLYEQNLSDESRLTKYLDKNNVKGNIEFKNVKFGYDKEKPIIKDFSAFIKSGQKVAIVGPTGAGKTTMVNLLMKFYEIDSGDIIIDGISIKDLTRENIHDLFVMVLQDTWLFEGTIKENIIFNKNDVQDKDIWNACKTVGVDHFIKTLPGELEAKLGDNDTISQGQKQLLTIARGMIEKAPFLILDEATSNVDTRTEELVQKAMDKLTEGKTSFIIAHRLSTIKNADLILVMNEGNIIEQGTHDELMKKEGFYSKLYNSQFEL